MPPNTLSRPPIPSCSPFTPALKWWAILSPRCGMNCAMTHWCFGGTGDPSFLHSDLKGTKAWNFLKHTSQKLYYSAAGYANDFYGAGWAWDDYNDYYQAEITGLPIADNVALLYADHDGNLQVKPSYLKRFLNADTSYHPDRFRIKRDFLSNNFVYPVMPIPPTSGRKFHGKQVRNWHWLYCVIHWRNQYGL